MVSCLKLIAAAMATGLLLTTAGCASTDDTNTPDGGTVTQSTGAVAIFTPSDGITLSQHTPLNKWAKLVPDITSELKKQGFKSANITTTTSSDLAKQSQDIQDYVVNHAVAAQSGKDSANKKDGADEKAITLIVAPAAETQTSTRQYGDYVSQTSGTATDRTGSDEAGSTDASESTDTPESANASSSDNASDSTDTESMPRMANALQLAKDSGMHVVLVANPVKDFTPDAFVELSTAERIGQIQASKLADKLQLDTISKDNPKAVEILLPYTASADGSDDEFAKEAFAGAWSVLQPYFKKGTAYSPSGLLTADTTDGQWESVAFKIDKDSRITDEITNRLKQKNSASHTRIDGIIAMNDYVASGVVDALDHLGYTGSAADINPSITLPGIVGNITGKQDLHRKKVPDPIKAPENDGDATNDGSASEKARDTQCPSSPDMRVRRRTAATRQRPSMDDRRRGPQGRRDAARADVPENQSGHGGEIAAEPDQGDVSGRRGEEHADAAPRPGRDQRVEPQEHADRPRLHHSGRRGDVTAAGIARHRECSRRGNTEIYASRPSPQPSVMMTGTG